jgi:hypothetical protein
MFQENSVPGPQGSKAVLYIKYLFGLEICTSDGRIVLCLAALARREFAAQRR